MIIMRKILFTILVSMLAAASAFAQQTMLRSAYFMSGYNGRGDLNPAFSAERSYFSLPSLGGTALSAQSNMGVSTFLYPVDGQLTTFMSSAVSPDDFLGKLKNSNRLGVNVDMSIFSLGIWGKKSFFTFGIRQRVNAGLNVPYSLFDFMKNAGKSQYYDISDMAVKADAYMEYSFGWSRQFADKINVGARVKFLMGEGSAEARIDKMRVRMTEDKWSVTSSGTLTAACGLLDVKTKGETGADIDSPEDADLLDKFGFKEFNGSDIGSVIGGYGAAIDLGAELELIPGLRLSIALNDIGGISWNSVTEAKTRKDSWSFEGFDNISFDEGEGKENSLSEQFKTLGDDLQDLAKFYRTAKDASKFKMLTMTLNFGAEYVMPFYKGLTAGFLSSTRFNGPCTWSEGRFYANLKPCKWFSLATNYAISSYGSTMGAALGFHTAGFNMFLGADAIGFKYAKATVEGIPYPYGQLHLGLNFGISFNVGRRHDTAPRQALISL